MKTREFQYAPRVINSTEYHSETFKAIRERKEGYALEIINKYPEIINMKDANHHTTLLIAAARKGSVAVVNLLLEKKANIEDKDAKGATALIHASFKHRLPVIEKLLEKGANLTPLSINLNAIDIAIPLEASYKKALICLPVINLLFDYNGHMSTDGTLLKKFTELLKYSNYASYEVYRSFNHFVKQMNQDAKFATKVEKLNIHWNNYYNIVLLSARLTNNHIDEATGRSIPKEIRNLVLEYDAISIVNRITFFNENNKFVTYANIKKIASKNKLSKI